MKNFNQILIGLAFLFCCNPGNAQSSLTDYLQNQVTQREIPGLSVLVFKENQILYEHYFGKSNLANNTSLERDDLFVLASISKTVTGTAIMQLVEEEAFDFNTTIADVLDTPINDYFEDDPNQADYFQVNVPGYANDPITLKMLLTHTSSIADDPDDVLEQYYTRNTDPNISLRELLRRFLVDQSHPDYRTSNFTGEQPGSKHEYSNVGTALIGLLVEEITGMDFAEYCRENIFDPLGMDNSYWRFAEINADNRNITTLYEIDLDNCNLTNRTAVVPYTSGDYPNGMLYSTTYDMHKFLSAFTNQGTSNGYQLLKPATAAAMVTAQTPILEPEMGLHFFMEINRMVNGQSLQMWGHNGAEEGISSLMAYNKSDNIGAIILSSQIEDPSNNCEDIDLSDMLVEAYKEGVNLSTNLPLDITSFQVEKQDKKAMLKWETTDEMDNAGFEIEYSRDGKSFEKVGWVKAKGSQNTTKKYQFIHQPTGTGTFYYRLKQLDSTGKYEYSTVKNLIVATTNEVIIFPNPTVQQTTIAYQLATSGIVSISIHDLNGRVVAILTNEELQSAGSHKMTYQTPNIPRGIYTLLLKTNEQSVTKRLIILE